MFVIHRRETASDASRVVRVWKLHTCAFCGARFRYLLERVVASQQAFTSDPANLSNPVLLEQLRHEIDEHPCPSCGRLQPEMVGRRRGILHGSLLAASLALPFCLAQAAGVRWHNYPRLLIPTFAALALFQLLALLVGRGTRLRVDIAAREVEAGALRMDGKSDFVPGRPVTPWLVALVLMGLAVILPVSIDALTWLRHWPLNENLDPAVVGPGDRPRVTGQCLQRGAWVSVTMPDGTADAYLETEKVSSNLGDREGQFLQIRRAPELAGRKIHAGFDIQLAELGAGTTYSWCWYLTVFGSIVSMFAGGAVLWRAAHAPAPDTSVEPAAL